MLKPFVVENDEDTLDNWLIRDDSGQVIAVLPKGPTEEAKEHQWMVANLFAASPQLLEALANCITNENCTAIRTSDVAYMIRRFQAINKYCREAIDKTRCTVTT